MAIGRKVTKALALRCPTVPQLQGSTKTCGCRVHGKTVYLRVAETEPEGVDLDVKIIGEDVDAPAANSLVLLRPVEHGLCRAYQLIRYTGKPLQPGKKFGTDNGNGRPSLY